MLTKEDRKWLTGEETYEGEEYGRQRRYERKKQIRERVQHTLLDFGLLFHRLEQEERDKIISTDAHDQYRYHAGMVAAAAFFYEIHETKGWDFGEFLTRAVSEMWSNVNRDPSGKTLTGDVPWDPPLDDWGAEERLFKAAREKFKRGDRLTNAEIGILVRREGLLLTENLDVFRDRLAEMNRERRHEDIQADIDKNVEMFGDEYGPRPVFDHDMFLDEEEEDEE